MSQERDRVSIPAQFHPFLARAEERAAALGAGAALRLVGSRGAGYHDHTSDLDMWVVGDRASLMPAEAREYDATGQVFVDRGDYEAHWTFYDAQDLARQFAAGHDERLWTFLNSHHIAGPTTVTDDLCARFARYPTELAGMKLRWLLGRILAIRGGLRHVTRGDGVTAITIACEVAQCLQRMCCLAERRPFPYPKWLARAARVTDLGRELCPRIDCAIGSVGDACAPGAVANHVDWAPVQELRACVDLTPSLLRDLGWEGAWLDDQSTAIGAAMHGPCPNPGGYRRSVASVASVADGLAATCRSRTSTASASGGCLPSLRTDVQLPTAFCPPPAAGSILLSGTRGPFSVARWLSQNHRRPSPSSGNTASMRAAR